MNVRQLTVAPKHKPPSEEIVKYMERSLEMAKSGEIQSVVMILELTDGYEQHICTTGSDLTVLLGMFARATHKLNMRLDDSVEVV